jgi:hypothetical protein
MFVLSKSPTAATRLPGDTGTTPIHGNLQLLAIVDVTAMIHRSGDLRRGKSNPGATKVCAAATFSRARRLLHEQAVHLERQHALIV